MNFGERSDSDIIKMMMNVSQGKALGVDGVSDEFFRVEKTRDHKRDQERNLKKVMFCRSLMST